MDRKTVETVGDHRAGRAAGLVIGPEHEVIDEQLRAPGKQILQRPRARFGVESVRPCRSRTQGRRWRSRATSSLRRVRSFSAASRSRRASQPGFARCGYVHRHFFTPFASVGHPLPRRLAGRRQWDRLSAGRKATGSDKCVGIWMDSVIAAAARALASGDALGALNYIALRDDPPALALRGIAMAQLNDFARARKLLRRAARAFGAARGGRAGALHRRRGRDRAWSRAISTGRQGRSIGARGARATRRPRQRRPCALSRDPAAAADRPARRGRASDRSVRSRRRCRPPRAPPTSSTRRRRRDAASADRRGARRAARRPRSRRAQAAHPVAHRRGRERGPRCSMRPRRG